MNEIDIRSFRVTPNQRYVLNTEKKKEKKV